MKARIKKSFILTCFWISYLVVLFNFEPGPLSRLYSRLEEQWAVVTPHSCRQCSQNVLC